MCVQNCDKTGGFSLIECLSLFHKLIMISFKNIYKCGALHEFLNGCPNWHRSYGPHSYESFISHFHLRMEDYNTVVGMMFTTLRWPFWHEVVFKPGKIPGVFFGVLITQKCLQKTILRLLAFFSFFLLQIF